MKKVLVINPKDNVAVALTEIKAGEKISIEVGGKQIEITARSDIPFGHKLAIKKILKGDEVVKYGEVIGKATADIEVGEHVHVHNVKSLVGSPHARR